MRILLGLIGLAAAALSLPTSAADPLGNEQALRAAPRAGPLMEEPAPSPEDAADLAAADPALTDVMDRLERIARLPAGAAPMASYTRYYGWADANRTKVAGVLVQGAAPGRKWLSFDDLPLPMDGGCRVVTLVFDASRSTMDQLDCNPG